MSSRVILFAALIAVIGLSSKVESSPSNKVANIHNISYKKVLERVKKQLQKLKKINKKVMGSSSSSWDDSDSDSDYSDYYDDSDSDAYRRKKKDRMKSLKKLIENDNDINGRVLLRSGKNNYEGRKLYISNDSDNDRMRKEIIDLIESVANTKNNNDHESKPNYGQKSYKIVHNNNYANTQSIKNEVRKQILEKLFSKTSNDKESKPKPEGGRPKKRLKPNRLIPSTLTINDVKKFYEEKNKNDEATGLEDYSKIYIVLNPQAVPKKKNPNSLYDIVSKVLSMSSQTSKREVQVKRLPRRYKGFVLNQNYSQRRFGGIKDIAEYVPTGEVEMQRATHAANNYK